MALLSNSIASELVSEASQIMLQACFDTVTIYRPTVTQGALGGSNYNVNIATATVIAADLRCNIQNVKPKERDTFDRRGIKVSNKIFFPQVVDTRIGDFIPDPQDSSQTYVVTFDSDMGGAHQVSQCYVDLIK